MTSVELPTVRDRGDNQRARSACSGMRIDCCEPLAVCPHVTRNTGVDQACIFQRLDSEDALRDAFTASPGGLPLCCMRSTACFSIAELSRYGSG